MYLLLCIIFLIVSTTNASWSASEPSHEGQKAFNYQMGLRKAKLLKAVSGPNDTPFEKAVKEIMTQFVIEAEAEMMMERALASSASQQPPSRSPRQTEEDFEDLLQAALKYREQAQAANSTATTVDTTPLGELAESESQTQPTTTDTPVVQGPPKTLRPTGGLWGAVEGFVSIIPYAPGAAVETTGNLAKYLVGLLPLPNVTEVVATTTTGIRKRPLHTAIAGLSNLVFCSPPIAGLNYGRCYAWFQTRENEHEIRYWKLTNDTDYNKIFFGIFD